MKKNFLIILIILMIVMTTMTIVITKNTEKKNQNESNNITTTNGQKTENTEENNISTDENITNSITESIPTNTTVPTSTNESNTTVVVTTKEEQTTITTKIGATNKTSTPTTKVSSTTKSGVSTTTKPVTSTAKTTTKPGATTTTKQTATKVTNTTKITTKTTTTTKVSTPPKPTTTTTTVTYKTETEETKETIHGTIITKKYNVRYKVYPDGTKEKITSEYMGADIDYSGYNGNTQNLKNEATSLANSNASKYNEVLKYTNEYRAEQQIAPLTIDASLSQAATIRAMEMALGNKFDHYRPDGSLFTSIIKELNIQGRYATAENIARGQTTPASACSSWKSSSGHYINIMNETYTRVGIGNYVFNGKNYWVQIFTN